MTWGKIVHHFFIGFENWNQQNEGMHIFSSSVVSYTSIILQVALLLLSHLHQIHFIVHRLRYLFYFNVSFVQVFPHNYFFLNLLFFFIILTLFNLIFWIFPTDFLYMLWRGDCSNNSSIYSNSNGRMGKLWLLLLTNFLWL